MDPITIILLDKTEDIFTPTSHQNIEQVLWDICQKHDLDPTKHALSYKNYFLPNNFSLKTLNLQKDENLKLEKDFRPNDGQLVTITLRVKDSYVSGNFNPDVTLWRVVKNLVANVTLKIPSSTPILIRKGVEYIGREDLMKVTPRSLGFTSGYLFFRFSVIENAVLSKRTGGLLGSTESLQFEMTRSFDYLGSVAPRVVSTYNIKGQEPSITFYPGISRRNSSVFGEINYLGDRNAVACRLPRHKLTARQKERRDSFYDMHVEDVKTMFNLVRDKRKELRERLIKSHGPTEKISGSRNKFTVIRVQFPDRTVLQGFFKVDDKIREVGEFVKLYRRIPRKFHLLTGAQTEKLHSEKTLAEYDLVPVGKIYYKIVEEDQPTNMAYLKERVLRRLTPHECACYAAALCHYIEEPKHETRDSQESTEKTRGSSFIDTKPFLLNPYESRISHFRF